MADNSTQIQNETIKRQVRVVQLGQGQGAQAIKLVDSTEKELKAAIAIALIDLTKEPTKANYDRLASLQRKIERIRFSAFREAMQENAEEMEQLAENESEWFLLLLIGLALLPSTSTKPTELMLKKLTTYTSFAGLTITQWWANAATSDVARIMLAIRTGLQAGMNTKEIITAVTGTRTVSGATQATRNNISAITKTIATGVSNSARQLTAVRTKKLDRVIWVSVLDSRTSTICRGLSGKVWSIDEDHPVPPAHANCRSTLSYIVTGEPIPEEPSYDEWIRQQPEDVQREILPNWQYKAMKKGTPLSSFTSRDMRPLTMQEFRSK